jgi:fructose 1,6-bisphosphate aldolase/phosphatase
LLFADDQTSPGAWNPSLYKMFCDPFNTAGLIIDNGMHVGFTPEVHDLIEHQRTLFNCPEDLYDRLVYIGTTGRFVNKHVFRRGNLDDPVASTSTSGATHLFEEPGALGEVARLASEWFERHLTRGTPGKA